MDFETNPIFSPTLPEEAPPEAMSADMTQAASGELIEQAANAEPLPDTPADAFEPDQTPDGQAVAAEFATQDPSQAEEPEPLGADSPADSGRVTVVDVQFKSSGKIYYFDPGDLVIPDDVDVIIETTRGVEYGHCVMGNHTVPAAMVVQPLRPVVRIATKQDRQLLESYRAKEPEALRICEEKILQHGLDMKLVSAEYAFDGSKILFFFTSDGRVDFRELVKNLAAVFRTRIELRQIGVRDEAKMLGGLGICGRPFCCAQFLDDFQPVSIKMAKTQSLSLNPTKISGTCGRLMCCLKYEQEAYESLQKEAPKTASLVDTPEGKGTIEDIILLRRQAKVRLYAHPDTIKAFSWDDLTVLRSGKASREEMEAEAAEAAAAAEAARKQYPRLTGLGSEETGQDQSSKNRRRNRSGRTQGAESETQQTQQTQARKKQSGKTRSGKQNRAPAQTQEKPAKPEADEPADSQNAGGEARKTGSRRRNSYKGRGKRSGEQARDQQASGEGASS